MKTYVFQLTLCGAATSRLGINGGMKPTNSLRKQADKAEAVALHSEDTEHAERMRYLAEAFRTK
jgi:hypothetical protein